MPTLTFLKITNNHSTPIRCFINRKKLISSSPISINERSIIKLSNMNILKLSNNDLKNLILDLKPQLIDLIMTRPLIDLFKLGHGNSNNEKLSFDNMGNQWKCKIIISLYFIINTRFKLGYLNHKDMQWCLEKKINMSIITTGGTSGSGVNDLNLITRELKFNLPKEFKSDDDDEFGDNLNDDKKNLNYKLKKVNLINNKLNNPIDLYVYKRP